MQPTAEIPSSPNVEELETEDMEDLNTGQIFKLATCYTFESWHSEGAES
jgi:hypothetical protein